MPSPHRERHEDTDAARRCIAVAAGLPPAWRKLLIAVACREAPEDVTAENGRAYGEHGRALFTAIIQRNDTKI